MRTWQREKINAKLLRPIAAALVIMPATVKAIAAVVIISLVLATAWLVYAMGGIRYSWSHLIYIPVVLGGFAFGIRGGVLAGIASGLALGPLMPINTFTGEMQTFLNWIYRLIFLCINGALVGALSHLFRRYLHKLEWLRTHHEGADVLNLSGLTQALDTKIRKTPKGITLIVSVIQLNAFLDIQNTFGSSFSTRLLAQIIDRTKQIVPPRSLLALIQDDRLAIVTDDVESRQLALARIEGIFDESYIVDGVPIHVDASIGVAHFPDHAQTAEGLLQKACVAMYSANLRKSRSALYNIANDRTNKENLSLLGMLPGAIARGELSVWYQAKVALSTDDVAGSEALVRWLHPQRGLIMPGLFIPQVEETMLIDRVTRNVIATAFADAAGWRTAGYPQRVAVNISVRNLRDHGLLDAIDLNARRCGLMADDIELEITESAVMMDVDHGIRVISELRERGYRVAIDDFGVGHSSLAYLQKMRASALKIDQMFIRTLAADPNNQKIVRAILLLARSLGLETVAEGIEDPVSLSLLREWGCDYGQGYAIHRPSPEPEFRRFLESRMAPSLSSSS
ncbi:MAG: GGDEF domain-containing protein [Paraburkholderia sp.]|uniref:putative bifunctional diguanylate cyclase/phosphodiesterase n=1 Tax=Paraburkholderia sp. TaxID=1926495 RepID=UPI0011FDF77E|nr:GGDEF domain-containing phosphodiesterase [Paraburkholderia sp.]TAM02332.1 MAG: GGDEF domain-containing protein [Paraburkholderia sp.]